MAIKRKANEDFSDEKIEKVIALLAKNETKKSCCEVLGIAYNTTRLAKIIQEWEDRKSFLVNQRKKLRGTPLSKQDITYIVQAYLNNEAISNIADNVFRSDSIVKNVLARYGVPIRKLGTNYFDPIFIETDTPDDYKSGDLVFSARYNTIAEVIKKVDDGVYRIYIQGKNEQYAYQPNYELGDLRKVQKELGIDAEWLEGDDINYLIMEARKNAKKKQQPKR